VHAVSCSCQLLFTHVPQVPKLDRVPLGGWFCPNCRDQEMAVRPIWYLYWCHRLSIRFFAKSEIRITRSSAPNVLLKKFEDVSGTVSWLVEASTRLILLGIDPTPAAVPTVDQCEGSVPSVRGVVSAGDSC
jgi:hypothetical protein